MREIREFLSWVLEEVRRVEGITEQREEAYAAIAPSAAASVEGLGAVIAAKEAIYTNSLKRERQRLLAEVKKRAKELAEEFRARIDVFTRLEYDYFFRRSEGVRITGVVVRVPLVERPERDSDIPQFKEFSLDLGSGEVSEHEFLGTSMWNYSKNEWRRPFNSPHPVIV